MVSLLLHKAQLTLLKLAAVNSCNKRAVSMDCTTRNFYHFLTTYACKLEGQWTQIALRLSLCVKLKTKKSSHLMSQEHRLVFVLVFRNQSKIHLYVRNLYLHLVVVPIEKLYVLLNAIVSKVICGCLSLNLTSLAQIPPE